MKSLAAPLLIFSCIATSSQALSAQITDPAKQERFEQMSTRSEERGLAEPFVGITVDGTPEKDLYKVRSTGVSTEPVRQAALAFLNTLEDYQKGQTLFDVKDEEWRKWMNQHFYARQGMGFAGMSDVQREAALKLMRSSLSADGMTLSRDIMKLNHTLAEINDNFQEYGEWLYWITIMGEPSATEPWGWQIDGHHLIINYFVLGDQVVMTPFFVGSEPVIAESGKYKGTSILQAEQQAGLDMLHALNNDQQKSAIIEVSKTGNNILTEAFSDNVQLDYVGAKASTFSKDQKEQFLDLISLYIDNMDEGHARVKMEEVEKHLDETWFAWIGGMGEDAVFYYRIYSPVLLIEYDHQGPVATRQLYGSAPSRQHVHVVVRTPNGGDYGKDLLRQHYAEHAHE